jgi:very-short-patch-repair endonuclease
MQLSDVTKEWLEKEYAARSFQDIAEQLGTYTNAVRRLAIKLGIPPKDKSAAQALALKYGRHGHPSKGRKRSKAEKIAISEGVAKSWKTMSDEDYQKRVEQGKQQWASLSEEEVERIQSLAMEAVRKASKEGSLLERFLVQHLKENGFLIEFHKKHFIANDAMELDMYLPERKIAIEIDGPTHFLPIWGEEALAKTIKADNEKNVLLLTYGVSVIRVKQIKKNLSMKDMRDIGNAVNDAINSLMRDKAAKVGKIILVEINDAR